MVYTLSTHPGMHLVRTYWYTSTVVQLSSAAVVLHRVWLTTQGLPVPLLSGVGRVFAATFSKLCDISPRPPSVHQNALSQGTENPLPPSPPAAATATGCSNNGVSCETAKNGGGGEGVPRPFKEAYPKVRVVGDKKGFLGFKEALFPKVGVLLYVDLPLCGDCA